MNEISQPLIDNMIDLKPDEGSPILLNVPYTVVIKSIDLDGTGITSINGKVVFVNDVLPLETVVIEVYQHKKNYSKAKLISIIQASEHRVAPLCPSYGICGGCSMQHIDFVAQVQYKQQNLLEKFQHIAGIQPQEVLSPIMGKPWHYRHRARLSVRYVEKKGRVLIGFHEKNSHFVTNMQECMILPQYISNLIPVLAQTIEQLSICKHIPQIEVAVGDNVSALVFRIMQTLTAADELILRNFIDNQSTTSNPLQLWLQPGNLDSCYQFYSVTDSKLQYNLLKFKLHMPFLPTEFIQVNSSVNSELVALAIDLINPQPHETIVDFFCGIGNFTFALAKHAQAVIGIDGNDKLINRAIENAQINNLTHQTKYLCANLFTIDATYLDQLGHVDKWLIDPPRDGAWQLINSITLNNAPASIVYVSCNPATLARDAHILVTKYNYVLCKSGIINMFPHTSHIESIAIFIKELN